MWMQAYFDSHIDRDVAAFSKRLPWFARENLFQGEDLDMGIAKEILEKQGDLYRFKETRTGE